MWNTREYEMSFVDLHSVGLTRQAQMFSEIMTDVGLVL